MYHSALEVTAHYMPDCVTEGKKSLKHQSKSLW